MTITWPNSITAGVELPSSTSVLNNLTINDSGGVVLGASPKVNGILSFTSGKITTNANTITLGSSATLTGEVLGKYVVGNLTTTRSVGTGSSTFGGMGVSLAVEQII